MRFSVVRAVCTIVFAIFCWLWLYAFQADALAVVLQVRGLECNSGILLMGALLTTVCLLVLQFLVWLLIPLRGYFYAFTFVPSSILLAMLSRTPLFIDEGTSMLRFFLVPVLLIALYLFAALIIRGGQIGSQHTVHILFLRLTWVNVLILLFQMACVAASCNTNAVYLYRVRIEQLMLKGQFDKALLIGDRSLETDGSLTMLRVYALARQGVLGEQLFHYPVIGSSESMLPSGGAQLLCYPADSLYQYLRSSSSAQADYLLCGLLIDRDLDKFARQLKHFYPDMINLPRHYREAITLYNHLRSQPVVEFHDPVLEEDFRNYQELKRKYPLVTERRYRLLKVYGHSYWFYYECSK